MILYLFPGDRRRVIYIKYEQTNLDDHSGWSGGGAPDFLGSKN